MLDDRVRETLTRLESEDAADKAAGLPAEERSLPVGPDAGRLLFALAALRPRCRVLELGSSRGYSTIWLAAAARLVQGSVVSTELDPAKFEAWHGNIAAAGLVEWAQLEEGDGFTTLERLTGPFDVVLLDAWKDDYERFFERVRAKLEPGSVVAADNVHSNPVVAAYAVARQADPTLSSVTIELGNGIELSTVLRP